jgi:predicted ribosome quality control (RQC) complex YloA/Tae2 family protein
VVTLEQQDPEGLVVSAPLALGFKPSFTESANVISLATANDAARKAFLLCRERIAEQDRRRGASKEIRIMLRRVARTRRAVMSELEEAKTAADVRRKGELILAHLARISKGQTIVELISPEGDDQRKLRIALKAHLTPPENAAVYFKRAKKLEKKLSFLPGRLEQLSKEEARLQKKLGLALSGTLALKTAKAQGPAGQAESRPDRWPTGISPRRFTSFDGWTMYVGRNNRENDYITFVLARPNDFWFHAQGVAGSHVILRREGRKSRPSKRCLEETASVAAYFSKGRTSQTVSVIYTEKKYVRKPRKAKAGMALHSHEKTLLVSPGLPPAQTPQS